MKKAEIVIAQNSLKGRRKNNQDAIASIRFQVRDKKILIIAVADGMGGYRGGDFASRRAVDTFCSQMKFYLTRAQDFHQIRDFISESYNQINRDIYKESLEDEQLADMGTTLTTLIVLGDEYLMANVGDSRGYIIREEDIWQVTEDHSAVAEALKEGFYSPVQIKKMPFQNALTRNLGNSDEVKVDIFPKNGFFKVDQGEVVCLLTDGITSVLSELQLYEQVITTGNLNAAAQAITSLAYQKGSTDNLSVVLAEFGGLSRKEHMAPGYFGKKKRRRIKLSHSAKLWLFLIIVGAFLMAIAWLFFLKK